VSTHLVISASCDGSDIIKAQHFIIINNLVLNEIYKPQFLQINLSKCSV